MVNSRPFVLVDICMASARVIIPVVDGSDSSLYIVAFGAVEVFLISSVLGLHVNLIQAQNRFFARPYYANNVCRRSCEECV